MFSVERHIRGKWVCDNCETLIQGPVPVQVIDEGTPAAGLLAQMMIAKYADHLPLHRQEQIFGRAGPAISRSTLASWVGVCGAQLQPLVDALREVALEHNVVHVDEAPVRSLGVDDLSLDAVGQTCSLRGQVLLSRPRWLFGFGHYQILARSRLIA